MLGGYHSLPMIPVSEVRDREGLFCSRSVCLFQISSVLHPPIPKSDENINPQFRKFWLERRMMDACYNKFLKICYILTSYWSVKLLQVSYFTLYYCGGKGVYLVYTSLSKSIIEESQGKNSRLLSMACSVWFLPQPRTICQGVTSPSVGWVFPYQLLIKTCTITLSIADQMEENTESSVTR